MFSILRQVARKVGFASSQPDPFPNWTSRIPELSRYSIGDWTYGNPMVRDWNQGTALVIGKYCSIADGVKILLGGEHRTDWLSTFPFTELFSTLDTPRIGTTKGDVHIGHDVWIGSDALILSGVTVGSGAVIAARSVVTSSVQPYSIVAGNPARHIRFRLSEQVIPQMLAIAWWNWPHNQVIKAVPILLSSRIEEFVQFYGALNHGERNAENSH
jgi:acetyltransferase-like isoleucine patch superfamily enzyme